MQDSSGYQKLGTERMAKLEDVCQRVHITLLYYVNKFRDYYINTIISNNIFCTWNLVRVHIKDIYHMQMVPMRW